MKHWYHAILSENDRPIIEAAVAESERKTNAEIVPMIVRRCSDIHEFSRAVLAGALLGFAIGYAIEHYLPYPAPYFAVAGALLSMLLARFTPAGRLLIPANERQDESEIRAELEFYRQKISSTKDAVGILLFVSVFDRQVVVLADEAISKKLPEETWNEVCRKIVLGLKKGTFAASMAEAIHDVGTLCAPHFPPKDVDVNELSNHLVIKE